MTRQPLLRSRSRTILIAGVLSVISLGAAACGSSSSSSTTTTKATTTTMAAPTTTAAAAPTTTVPCTPAGTPSTGGPPPTLCLNDVFKTPSTNINCELSADKVYCQSINKPNSVVLSADGDCKAMQWTKLHRQWSTRNAGFGLRLIGHQRWFHLQICDDRCDLHGGEWKRLHDQ